MLMGHVTLFRSKYVAGFCVSGQLNLVVHLLQNPLVQLDLGVTDRVPTGQNHGTPAPG